MNRNCDARCSVCSLRVPYTKNKCGAAGQGESVKPTAVGNCDKKFIKITGYADVSGQQLCTGAEAEVMYIPDNVCFNGAKLTCTAPEEPPKGVASPFLYLNMIGDRCNGPTSISMSIPTKKCTNQMLGPTDAGQIFQCPAPHAKSIATGNLCLKARVDFVGPSCTGASSLQTIPCGVCYFENGGYVKTTCNDATDSVVVYRGCNNGCTKCAITLTVKVNNKCQNLIKLGIWVQPVSIATCTKQFITVETYDNIKDKPMAASCTPKANVVGAKVVSFIPDGSCQNGVWYGCAPLKPGVKPSLNSIKRLIQAAMKKVM